MNFKRILMAAILMFFCISSSAIAEDIYLQWGACTATDSLGYKVYVATAPGGQIIGGGNEIALVPLGTEFYIYEVPGDGTYYFKVSTYDDAGNERVSNECYETVDETAPEWSGGLQCFIGASGGG